MDVAKASGSKEKSYLTSFILTYLRRVTEYVLYGIGGDKVSITSLLPLLYQSINSRDGRRLVELPWTLGQPSRRQGGADSLPSLRAKTEPVSSHVNQVE